jgi:thiamine-phosphate pyrophosphorylase
MRGLYAILDVKTLTARRVDPVAFARAVLAARPAALQVRAKDLSTREFFALLRTVAPLCREMSVPLIANDRVDLAALAGCDYVHIGQDDLPLELVRRIAPMLRVGISTHTLEQVDRALAQRPAYIAFGPVYPTATKQDPDPCVGLAGLRVAAARANAARVPLVAIGGITLARAREIGAFASAAAVIGALLPAEDVAHTVPELTARARLFQAALQGRASSEARV